MGNCNSSGTNGRYSAPAGSTTASSTAFQADCIAHDGPILGMCYADEGTLVSCGDRKIAIIDLPKLLSEPSYVPQYLCGHTKAVNRVRSVDSTIFSCSRDLSIRMWKKDTGECMRAFDNAHELNITAVAQSRFDQATVISGSRDYHVKCWDVATGQCVASYSTPRNIVTALEPSPVQPGLLYQGSEDLFIRVWDTRTATAAGPAQVISGFVYFPVCMSIHAEGNLLATGCKGFDSVGCTVKLWDLRHTAQPVQEYAGHSQDVVGCAFSHHDPRLLVSTSKDGSVRVWDTAQTGPGAEAAHAHLSHTGHLNSCLAAPAAPVVDASMDKGMGQLARTDFPQAPQLNGNCVAVGGMDRTITLASIGEDRSASKGRVEVFCTTSVTASNQEVEM